MALLWPQKDYTLVIVTLSMQQAARIPDYKGFFLTGNWLSSCKPDKFSIILKSEVLRIILLAGLGD